VSLNIWGGKLEQELHDFIAKHAADTDIFCFQEVFDNAINAREVLGNIDINSYQTLCAILPEFKGYYAPSQDDDEGLAIFVKPTVAVNTIGDTFVYRYRNAMIDGDGTTMGRNIQFITLTENSHEYTIINFHGLWNGGGKTDSPDRIEQSGSIRNFIDTQATGSVILIGDFNLGPSTESMTILEKGMRNLIKEYGITSTRSIHYEKSVKFADYAIVSNDLDVKHFEILPDVASDHLPLLLEF